MEMSDFLNMSSLHVIKLVFTGDIGGGRGTNQSPVIPLTILHAYADLWFWHDSIIYILMLHINATHFKMIFEIRLLQREKEKYNLINRVLQY